MTIIVPTDFSAVANNAARYALKMVTGYHDVSIILYHVYDKASEKQEANTLLEKLKTELLAGSIAKIDCKLEESGDLIDCLDRLSRHMAAQLIVMGITGKSRLEKVFLGSNTLKMVEKNICPVLVIPGSCRHGLKNIFKKENNHEKIPRCIVRPVLHSGNRPRC